MQTGQPAEYFFGQGFQTTVIIGIVADGRTGRVVIVSAIDNLVKGAAGQAVQNMNLMCGFSEDAGLNHISLFP